MKSRNGKLSKKLSSIFDKHVEMYMPGYTVGSAIYCHSGIDELGEQLGTESPRLYWSDKGEVGTYQFYIKDDELYVADYFDEEYIYSTHSLKDYESFDTQYDVVVTMAEIILILNKLIEHNAYAYMIIEPKMIGHKELMMRTGWNDRRIKKHFGIVPADEHDYEQYYSFVKVLEVETTRDA